MNAKHMLWGVLCTLAAVRWQGATAQEMPTTELEAVTTTATRGAERVKDAPGTITVIDQRQIERDNAQDIRDLVRYETGLSVGNNPTRTGSTSFVIRGIGENRVLIRSDGVRVPDAPQNGQPGTYFRDYVDLENLKRVEIIRGPGSALYGSNAIGGVVSYFTKDPSDYLDLFGRDFYASGKLAGDSADGSIAGTVTAAARDGRGEMLLLLTRRDGHEYGVRGNAVPNPQDYSVNNLLAKNVFKATPTDRLTAVVEFTNRNVNTNVLSDFSASVRSSKAHDSFDRRRFSLEYVDSEPVGWHDQASLILSYQDIARYQQLDTQRISGGQNVSRVARQTFRQGIFGAQLQLDKSFAFLDLPNKLTYGADLEYSQTTRPSDQSQMNPLTGTVTHNIPGVGNFPNKPFPDTRTVLAGAYVQDQIKLADRVTLVPALRIDYYNLAPHVDGQFLNSNPMNFTVANVTDAAVSPKLGLTYAVTEAINLYGQYARGFRSPPYDDANIAFSNPSNGYFIQPNPNLKSETSDGFEVGSKAVFPDGSSFSVAGFYNLYRDFISVVPIGFQNGLQVFQSRNLSRVHIYGAEARAQYKITPTIAALAGLAYASGEDEQRHVPIDSVDPFKIVSGLRYDDRSGKWGARIIGTFVARKSQVSDPSYFSAPGYAILDILAHWEPRPWITVNGGVFNVLNKKYWLAQDVVGLAANRPDLDRFTQPGTTFGANLTIRW